MNAWVEVDLDIIRENVGKIRRFIGPDTEVLAVVKSDAYGYGMKQVAEAALGGGASWLGVADIDEGIALRQAGFTAPVLILGRTPAVRAGDVIQHNLSQATGDADLLMALGKQAEKLNSQASIHLEIDTGMGITGVRPDKIKGLANLLASTPGVKVEGVFTHFANAGAQTPDGSRKQLAMFFRALEIVEAMGINPGIRHACSTGAIAQVPEAHLDMVRTGCGLHGMWAFSFPDPIGLTESMAFKAKVEAVKALPEGAEISYSSLFRCSRPTIVASIPVGYGYGLPRKLTNTGEVLIKGKRAPMIGLICMNRMAVDITGIPGVEPGDEVVICGSQGNEAIRIVESAMSAGLGVGEFLLPHFVRRVYISSGS